VKPSSGLGWGSETMGAKEQHPPCKNERLERVKLTPFLHTSII